MTLNKRSAKTLLAAAGLALSMGVVAPASASTVTYDFESLSDSEVVNNQFSGLTFTNTLAVKAGVGLNEIDFPPRSGSIAVFDDGGAIVIDLATSALSVSAYFNYTQVLTFSAYDSGNTLLGSSSSAFGSNIGTAGDPGSSTNELIGFSDLAGRIARIVITGSSAGTSFTMDDLSIEQAAAVPEPATAALVLGLLALGSVPGGWLRRR